LCDEVLAFERHTHHNRQANFKQANGKKLHEKTSDKPYKQRQTAQNTRKTKNGNGKPKSKATRKITFAFTTINAAQWRQKQKHLQRQNHRLSANLKHANHQETSSKKNNFANNSTEGVC
jgi:hypothetical protein